MQNVNLELWLLEGNFILSDCQRNVHGLFLYCEQLPSSPGFGKLQSLGFL